MVLVFDSTPLIYLGKVRVLNKLKSLKVKKIIPASIYQEVVKKGKLLGKEDAFYIENLTEEEVFEIAKAENQIKSLPSYNLSEADKEVLSLAKEKSGMAVIDEDAGRKIAEVEGIEVIGSVGILFNLLRKKIIDKKKLREIVDKMIEEGWYCSIELYSFIISKLDE